MLRHVGSDLELRDSSGPFDVMLRILPHCDMDVDLHQEIFRYRSGLESLVVKPFCQGKTWGVDKIHNHTVIALLLSPDRRTGMRLVSGVEITVLGCIKRDCYQHSSGYEILFLEAPPLPQSIVIRHPRNSVRRLVFDAYSGFGGWQKGGQIVGAPYRVFWEIDPEIAVLCSYNTGTHVLQTKDILSMTHDNFRHHLSTGITILGDFGEMAVWEYLCQDGIEWGSFSLPCPSWSRLGSERGLDDPRGSEHNTLLRFARCAQPLLLVLENVDALLSHRHWIDLRASFVELGFEILFVGSDSLQKVMPMSRNRACVIIANRAYASEFRAFELKSTEFPPLGFMMSPRAWGCIHECIPSELVSVITIPQKDRVLLGDRKVWPFDWGFPKTDAFTIPLKCRVHPKSQILPCAVAKYASPGDIARSLLESKGLFMKIMQQASDEDGNWYYRWISPFEQLASMGFPVGTMLPRNKSLAYHVVGNSIAVAHSVINLLRVRALLPNSFLPNGKSDLFDALVEMRHRTGKLPDLEFHYDEDYMWLNFRTVVPCVLPVPSTLIDMTQEGDRENSPETQQEVDAIAKLLQDEDANEHEMNMTRLTKRSVVPDAPYLFVPCDMSTEAHSEVMYQCKSLARCVPQLAFATCGRDVVVNTNLDHDMIAMEHPHVKVHLRTLDGTWQWQGITCVPFASIGHLICGALPHATQSLFDRFVYQGQDRLWEHCIDTRTVSDIQIALQPKYIARLFQVAPDQHLHPVLCDVCDTALSVAQCIFANFSEIKNAFCMTQHDEIVNPDDYILGCDRKVLTFQFHDQHQKGRVGIIHPFTGKFHELYVGQNCTISDIKRIVVPELLDVENIVAEINHQRVSSDMCIRDVDKNHVLRLRCFPLKGGARTDVRNQLREQLVSHGVPENQVASRIHTICTAIPEGKIVECFGQADVWGGLKNVCTAANIRLVHPQELKERQQSLRNAVRKGESIKPKAKGGGKGRNLVESSKHVPLLPPMVENVEFVQDFRGEDGSNVPIIFPSAMCTGGTGVCPMNLSQAKSFLPVTIISTDPLAILVLGHHDSLSEHKVTVAGTIKTTGIPCLLPATLIQFGASPVLYKFTGLKVEADTTESQIIEVIITKDKSKYWDSNIAPIDIVAKTIPAVKEKSILIGAWGWKSLDAQWKPTHASSSQVWRGNIRIASTAVKQLLKASGPDGISLWPKDNEYRADPEFVHITVKAESESQAQACAQKVPQNLGFVHHRGRYLIRCLRTNFNAVKMILNPEGCILDACEINPGDLRFVLSGLTEGYTASSITDGLKKAGWNARTVRALSAKTWLLVADQPPAATHLEFNGTLATVRPFQKEAPGRQYDSSFRAHHAMSMSSWSDDRSTASSVNSFCQGPIASKLDEIQAKLQETTEHLGTLTERVQDISDRQDTHEVQVAEQFIEVDQKQKQFLGNLEGAIVHQMKSMFSTFEGSLVTRLDRIESELAEDPEKRRKTN